VPDECNGTAESKGAEVQEIKDELEQAKLPGGALGATSTGSARNQWIH
jgi:hypothetical protein